MKKKNPENLHIAKLLKCVQTNPRLFQEKDVTFIVGLTATEISNTKRFIFENALATRIKQDLKLTDEGQKFIKNNPAVSWADGENPKRPNTNLEYLKLEKQPATLSKAIRQLAEHLLECIEMKQYSMEHNIYREIFNKHSIFSQVRIDAKKYLAQNIRIKLVDFYHKFMNKPYGLTKSLTSILLLYALVQIKDELAIYELFEFQLKLDSNMFFRMLHRPERFEVQRTVIDNLPVLEDISAFLLPCRSNNLLTITKGLISIIKSLDKYTLNTSRISTNSIRLRNAVTHAKDPVSLFYRDIPNILDDKLLCYCGSEFISKFEFCIKELQDNYSSLKKELLLFLFEVFNDSQRHSLKKRFELVEDYLNDKKLKVLYRNIKEDTAGDDLWIERISTFINGSRVPKDWTDEDVADFKIKLKELANSFLIIESTAGIAEIKFDKTMQDILSKLLKLSKNKQLLIAKKIVNG